jgi:2-keto-3-deoxy-L-fuconate dehydrogenase
MSLSLQNKRVLLTAAGQGIGRASAIAFARAGAKVVATDINAEALKSLAGEAGIETHVLDVLSDEAVNRVVSATGPFDVLFN